MTLFERLASEPVLYAAWEKVADNDGAAGVDGIELEDFEMRLSSNVHKLHLELMAREYQPSPLRRSYILKDDGSRRPLAIPTVSDRVVQTACALLLTPLLEPSFEPGSHGYRTGRGVQTAVAQLEALRDEGYTCVVDADIDDFFDEVDHERLLATLREHVKDEEVVGLVASWLRAPVEEGFQELESVKGLPQGSPVAPLLTNLYLEVLDETVAARGYKIVRYADDFVVLCKSPDDAATALQLVESLLADLKLTLQKRKTRLASFESGFDYLGGNFRGDVVTFPERPLAAELMPEITAGYALPEIPEGADFMPRYPLLRCLYVEAQGASLRKDQGRFVVQKGADTLFEVPIIKVEHIIVFGTAHVSTPVMKHCLASHIPITFISERGEYYGRLENPSRSQVELQPLQFDLAAEEPFRLATAQGILAAKLANSRTLLLRAQRNRKDPPTASLTDALAQIEACQDLIPDATSVQDLLGLEGAAAKAYYEAFGALLGGGWPFAGRSRQPPQDLVNSLLSFGYTLLFYNVYSLLCVNGLSPYVGNLHKARDRVPALAADLIEEFRSPVVDSLVLQLLNKSAFRPADFVYFEGSEGCFLAGHARRRFIEQFENRMRTPIVHPGTGYRVDWRRCVQLQIQSYKQTLRSEAAGYVGMTVR